MHGRWNRDDRSGYKVVIVPFRGERPAGKPIDFLTGFLAGGKTHGRPVGVLFDPARGALLVADDVSNTVWRITATVPVGRSSEAPIRAAQKEGQVGEFPIISPRRTDRSGAHSSLKAMLPLPKSITMVDPNRKRPNSSPWRNWIVWSA